MADGGATRQRIDTWLCYARLFKSRTRAAHACAAGEIRRNGLRVLSAHQGIAPGDVLTFACGREVRVIRVRAFAARRGPAAEARLLYDDLEPPSLPAPGAVGEDGLGGAQAR